MLRQHAVLLGILPYNLPLKLVFTRLNIHTNYLVVENWKMLLLTDWKMLLLTAESSLTMVGNAKIAKSTFSWNGSKASVDLRYVFRVCLGRSSSHSLYPVFHHNSTRTTNESIHGTFVCMRMCRPQAPSPGRVVFRNWCNRRVVLVKVGQRFARTFENNVSSSSLENRKKTQQHTMSQKY